LDIPPNENISLIAHLNIRLIVNFGGFALGMECEKLVTAGR